MQFNLENGALTIFLEGRIDSQTSLSIEESVVKVVEGKDFDSLILNLENVDFLSSAGLRVILRLKKKFTSLSIIDVTPDVYEIFEMTGFSEIMNIKRGFRKLSVDGVEEIGRGANGIVYRYAEDMIVKVYFNNADLDDIKNEVRLAKKAFVSGVSTAIPFDIVKVGKYYGSVFEMIKAESISGLINENPDKIDDYINEMIALLKILNSTIVNDDSVPTIKDIALNWITLIKEHIDQEQVDKLYKLFNAIPEDNNMLHRDFHIKNLLMQQGELILIDMDTLSKGNIIFELTGLFNAYKGFVQIRPATEKSFLGITNETSCYIWKKMLELYFPTKTSEELKIIEKKVETVSTVHLLKIHLGNFETEDKENKIIKLKNNLTRLLNEVDDLLI